MIRSPCHLGRLVPAVGSQAGAWMSTLFPTSRRRRALRPRCALFATRARPVCEHGRLVRLVDERATREAQYVRAVSGG
jgi:hypothetical protein